MPNAFTLIRRGLVVSALTLALGLMHGGIGQAMACAGMNQMAAMDAATSNAHAMTLDNTHVDDRHSQHHQPSGPPTAHGAEMCVSMPEGSGAGGSKVGPAIPVTLEHPLPPLSTCVGRVTRASGREPPAPDLVSDLCVNRV